MSMEVHQSHALMGEAKSGRTVISIPEIPSPAANHRENLIFTDNQKKEHPDSVVLGSSTTRIQNMAPQDANKIYMKQSALW